QSRGKFRSRAQSLPASGANWVRAVSQTADQFRRAFEGENAMGAMGADMQWLPATGACGLLHVQYQAVKRGAFRPTETHGLLLVGSLNSYYPIPPEDACLALYRPVDSKRSIMRLPLKNSPSPCARHCSMPWH